jgi:hypothetical protein
MDPLIMVVTLYACTLYYLKVLTPQYIVLSIFVFALSFPSDWEAKVLFFLSSKLWCISGVL